MAWPSKARARNGACRLKPPGPRNTFPAFRHYPISSFSLCTPYGRAPDQPQSFTFRPNTHFHGLVRRRKDGRIYRHSSHGPKLSFIQLGLPISVTLLDRHPEYSYQAAGMSKLVSTSSAMHSSKSCKVVGRIL
jgi:hypothetical protein